MVEADLETEADLLARNEGPNVCEHELKLSLAYLTISSGSASSLRS